MKLAKLRDDGILTQSEFETAKNRLLGGCPRAWVKSAHHQAGTN